MRFVTILALVLILLLRAGHPENAVGDDATVTLRTKVEALITGLDAATLAERSQAERSLLDLGPDVLKYFPAPELAPTPAVRESLKRIRIQLERRAARESAQASLVRFSGETTVAKLLTEFRDQTRNPIELAEDARSLATHTLQVDFDNKPFWECVDDLCARLKLTSTFDLHQGLLLLRLPSSKDLPELAVQRSGPYRLVIHSAEVRPIVGNSTSRLVRVSGKVGLEPRLRPLFVHFAAADLTASGAGERRLEPWNPSASYELSVGDAGREAPVQFDFLLPGGDDRKTIDIRGRLSTQLAAGTERIVFDQTAQAPGTVRRRGGVTVRLRDVTFETLPDGKLDADIKVTVGYDSGGPAFESHRTWIFHNAVYLENQIGTRVDFTDFDTALQTNGAVGVDYRWKSLPGPATYYHFVYEAPTLIIDLPLEVKLDTIPLKSANPLPK